jgi:hypothetical protein
MDRSLSFAALCWVAGERFSSLQVNGPPVMERSVLVSGFAGSHRSLTVAAPIRTAPPAAEGPK